MFDAQTHGKVYQDFEADNGTGSEYGWPVNGVSVALITEFKNSGDYSWKVEIPYSTPSWYGGFAVKSKVEQWHLDFEPYRHDRLTFWVKANPDISRPQAIRLKLFDHNNYTAGFVTQTDTQVPAGVWTKTTVYLSQLPEDFDFSDLDKIEFYLSNSGIYYFDDIEITSGDRVFQNFETRTGITVPSIDEYEWFSNGASALIGTEPAEGLQSWLISSATNWAGTHIKYQCKEYWDNTMPADIWNVSLWPAQTHSGLYQTFSCFFKQKGENLLENNAEISFFDNADYNANGIKIWSSRRSNYDSWNKISVSLKDFPEEFKFNAFNKIAVYTYWPGDYYYDDLRFLKYPTLHIDETLLSSGTVAWETHPGAVSYTLRRAKSAIGPWTNVYTGSDNLYLTSKLSDKFWYRVCWQSETDYDRGTVAYVSDWSDAVAYTPMPVLIEKDKLQNNGTIKWTFIPQTNIYQVQQSSAKNGRWTTIYTGNYQVTPLVAT